VHSTCLACNAVHARALAHGTEVHNIRARHADQSSAMPRQTGWAVTRCAFSHARLDGRSRCACLQPTTSLKVNLLTSFRAVVAIPCAEETVVHTIDENGAAVLNVICLPGLVGRQHRCALQAVHKHARVSQQQLGVLAWSVSHTSAGARTHTHGIYTMPICVATSSP
jgi:hypothetical protein